MKITKNILAVSIGLLSLLVMGSAVSEKMAHTMVTAQNTVSYYKTVQKKRSLTSDENKLLQFVQVAQDVFKINDFVIEGHYNEEGKEKALNLRSIARAIQNSIKLNGSWNEAIPSADLAKINSVEDLFKSSLGANSLVLAWLTYKNGNKSEAKILLNRGFDLAYESSMKMEVIGFSDETNPIQDAESFSKALTPLSTDAENKARAERLRKMQTRASNLPQIMT